MTAKLLPCPGCGKEPILQGESEHAYVRCVCGWRGPNAYLEDEEKCDECEAIAADLWNRRPSATPAAREVELPELPPYFDDWTDRTRQEVRAYATTALQSSASGREDSALLSEPEQRAEFVREAKRRGWTPGDFMLGAYAGWLAARNVNTTKGADHAE